MTAAAAPDPLDAPIEDSERLLQAHKLSCARQLANGDVVPAGDLIATSTMEIRLHNPRSLRRLNQITRTSPPPVHAIEELKQAAAAPARRTRKPTKTRFTATTNLRSALLRVLNDWDPDLDFGSGELRELLEQEGRPASKHAVTRRCGGWSAAVR